jgi:hypothetical protein
MHTLTNVYALQPTKETSKCPNVGSCSAFLEAMKAKHEYRAGKINWGFTTMANVLGDFDHTTAEYVPRLLRHSKSNTINVNGSGNNAINKSAKWRLYKCRTCGFLTHAVRSMDAGAGPSGSLSASQSGVTSSPAGPPSSSRPDAQVAIVMNLPVHSFTTDYTGSGLGRAAAHFC